ncbi:RT28-like protein, partial [Mya arenaria]
YLDTGRPFTDNVSEHETTIQEETKKSESFASLFRNSRLVQLGDLHRKILAGRIFQVINDDLYIDFGGKFMCVCNRPAYQPEKYTKGVRVRLFLNSFEMASSFMGSKKAVTLLEADCVLLGIFSPDSREERRQKSE